LKDRAAQDPVFGKAALLGGVLQNRRCLRSKKGKMPPIWRLF